MTDSTSYPALEAEILQSTLTANPVLATHLGRHDLDHLLPDFSLAACQQMNRRHRAYRSQLEPFLGDSSDLNQQVDAAILAQQLDQGLWEDEHLRGLDWDPLIWNGVVSHGLEALVSREFAPESVRMESFLARVRAIPDFLATARSRLKPRSRPHLEVAVAQLSGFSGLFRHFAGNAEVPPGLEASVIEAERALDEYKAFLETVRDQADPDGWRLGAEIYQPALTFTLDCDHSPEHLLQAAKTEVVEAQRQLLRAAREFLGQAPGDEVEGELRDSQRTTIQEAFALLGEKRATPETLVGACREAVETCRSLMLERELLPDLPPDELHVELWPEHSRGVAVACLDAPGPYEGPEARSYFYISPPPEDWSEEKRVSFLKEYNLAQILVLAAHEALPGHFAQLSLGRRHPSRVRSIFGSGTYCEGWAVYCERMMLEQGLGKGDPGVALATWKMRLRGAWNRVLDHWMHTGEKSPEECLEHLRRDGFQEAGEAEGKIVRAKVTSCQLSTYFTGAYEVEAIARDWRRAHPQAPIRELHRALLEHGAPAPRHLRRLLGLDSQEANKIS